MARIRIQRCGPGRPRTRPERVAADKGYSSMKIRTYLRRRGIKAAIPERIDQRPHPQGREPLPTRPGGLPATQRRRALLQQAQAQQSPGHPLRQTRPPLPGPGHPGLPQTLAALTLRTRPRPCIELELLPGWPFGVAASGHPDGQVLSDIIDAGRGGHLVLVPARSVRTSAIAQVMVERSTPNSSPSTACGRSCRRWISVATSRSTTPTGGGWRHPRPAFWPHRAA